MAVVVNKLKDNDTFYYVLPRYFLKNNEEHLEFHAFAYKFDPKLHHCFDESLMFDTKKEAEEKAKEMNKTEGY